MSGSQENLHVLVEQEQIFRPRRISQNFERLEFEFFVRLPGKSFERKLSVFTNENLEFCLRQLREQDDLGVADAELVFYLVDEDGAAETDLSPVDTKAPLAVVNCQRFALSSRSEVERDALSSPLMNKKE